MNRTHHILLPVNRLLFFLERARYLANRNDSNFCLLAISVGPDKSDGVAVLAEILHERLRITDDKGFLEDGRIGVVLQDTPEEGAHIVAQSIGKLYRDAGGTLTYELFVYPSDFDLDGVPVEEDEPSDTKQVRDSKAAVRSMESLFATKIPLWKRTVDIAGSLFLMVLLSPVVITSALLIRYSSPGPVFFVQKRSGLGGKPFMMYKLRTMRDRADSEKAELSQYNEQDGPAFKMANDPRVTKVGQLFRNTSIDELPQLFNVLRGEMSLVGPRPLPVEETAKCEMWQHRRMDVTPGLTCIWQVRGRSSVAFSQWIRMDLEYVEKVSFWNDLKLLVLTVPSVLSRKGAC
jgi:lipopolysaccharide/colanic/teichoic acid biosynthesis glycosyltransferase